MNRKSIPTTYDEVRACRCGRKETTEKRPTRAQRARGTYHTQEECFALDANGATCLWRAGAR